MKRLSLSFLLIAASLLALVPAESAAQSCCGLSTRAAESLRQMCQDGSCETPITPGTSTVTGCQNRVMFGDNSSVLNCEAAFGYVASTNTLTVDVFTASGASGTSLVNGGFILGNDTSVATTATAGELHLARTLGDGTTSFRLQNLNDGLGTTENAFLRWTSNAFTIGTETDGGTLRDVEFPNQTNISGPDATTNVEIGSRNANANAGTGGTSVVIGNSANNAGNGSGNTIIGSTAAVTGAGTVNTIVGTAANTVSGAAASTAIGASSTGGERGTAVGSSASATGGVAIGAGATAGVNQFVVGSSNTANTVITNTYLGNGVTNAAPTATTTINGTGGSGTNVAGTALAAAGGISTGSAAPADFRVRTTTALASGTTAQSLVDRVYVEGTLRALTDATATTVFTVTTGNDLSCGGTLFFTVEAADASNQQTTTGEVHFAAADNAAGAGGEACTAAVTGTNVTAATSGTLTVTADATTGTDLCNIRLTATGSLTETVGPRARYTIIFNPTSSSCAVTPQ